MPPSVLLSSLEAVRRKVRVLSVLFGAGVVVAAVMGLLLATVLLDYLLNLPAIPRLILILLALGGAIYFLIHWLIRPAKARLNLSDMAGRLEDAFPQFDDRLRSTVDFVTKANPGSPLMKELVVNQATDLAQRVDLTRAIDPRPAWYSVSGGVAALLVVFAIAGMVGPQYWGPAISRLVNPFGGQAWPKQTQIDLVGNVPQRVVVGQRVDLHIKLAKGDKSSVKAIVYYQYDNGRVEQEIMTRGADGVYSASLDARAGDDATANAASNGQMKIWMKAGDDQMSLAPLTVVQRLGIVHVEAVVKPPKYAQLHDSTLDLGSAPATVTYGSAIALKVTFNKPLDGSTPVTLMPVGQTKAPRVNWLPISGDTAACTWTAADSARFTIHATDIDGFSNTGLEEYQVIVRPDQMPTVQIEKPVRNEECTPEATVQLGGVAEDDFGIQTMNLMVTRLGDKKTWTIPLVADGNPTNAGVAWTRMDISGERRRFRADYGWDLSKLAGGIKPGDVLEYNLTVTDNFNLDGQTHPPISSGKLRITVVSQEQFTALVSDALSQLREQLSDVRSLQNRTKTETTDLKNDTHGKPAFDKADREVAQRLANQQSTAASQAKQIAARLSELSDRMTENKSKATDLKQVADDVKNALTDTAEHPMKEAAGAIDQAKEQKADPKASKDDQQKAEQQRNATLDSAQSAQQKAADNLQKAMDKMGTVGGLPEAIERVQHLLDEQQRLTKETADAGKNNLGKTPDAMNPDDRKKLEKAAQDQQELAKQAEKTMNDMAQRAEKLSKSDQPASDAMKQAAQTGQQQNVSGNMNQASKSASQNKQSDANAAQKQVEIGLQMMLNQLKEAERRKLEELVKQLDDLQKQIENLIRQQAGHNLDNLALQGADVLKKVDPAVLADLLTKSDRTADHLPPVPPVTQLTALQEQTERNTRNVAKTAEQLPDGAEPSAHLARAAERMGRAITNLRDTKLPDAYDPPQVEALAALEDARKLVEDQKNKAQNKVDEAQKETIRQAYIKIRDAQKKLNDETVSIDKAPRGDDGNLGHADAVRLASLPGTQGDLADKAHKLDDDLASVGSIVYVWANNDIVKSMKEVKDDLGKPETGIATQTEQARVLEQLDAMIKNLAIKPPKESKFAQGRNGGGGGQGQSGKPKPQLPPEAELKLLKDLQIAVNNATKILDAQPNKDQPKLEALGGRQGELRTLLDKLLQQASQGKVKLGPEPDDKDQLPEEASKDDVEGQELEQDLLNTGGGGNADDVDHDMHLIGSRMGRSHQRLQIHDDPGKVTQIIQERILKNFDQLIQMAQSQQQQQQQTASKPGQGQQQQPNPGDPQARNNPQPGQQRPNHGQTPAQQSTKPGGGSEAADLNKNIDETAREWGGTSPRRRQAVIDAKSESIVEKYKSFIDDYYRTLATKATEH